MKAGKPELPFSAFARISAMDVRTLPKPRFLDLGNDMRLGYRCYEADADVQLVLVHGSGCFGDQLHEMALRISRAGKAQVYTLNMRGHGLSDGERGHAVSSADEIVADVGQFLAHIRATRPDDRIILGGHSAGGGVILGVSRTDANDLVSGYIFLSPYLGIGSPTLRPYFGGWVGLRTMTLRALAALNLFGIKRFNNRTVVDFNVEACIHDPRFVRSWSFNTMLAFGAGPWLKNATPIPADKPVLMLAGDKDECFVQPLFPEAFDTIAPHAEMPPVGPSGHWDLLVDPLAISAMTGWLDCNFPATSFSTLNQEKHNEVAA